MARYAGNDVCGIVIAKTLTLIHQIYVTIKFKWSARGKFFRLVGQCHKKGVFMTVLLNAAVRGQAAAFGIATGIALATADIHNLSELVFYAPRTQTTEKHAAHIIN